MSPIEKYKHTIWLNWKTILDFWLKKSKLLEASRLAEWLGIQKIYIKLETDHPTKTIKDRATEVIYNYFHQNNITSFIHTSTGNTATSLVWWLKKYIQHNPSFHLTLLIPEKQLPYHNFENHPNLTVILLQWANYDQARNHLKKIQHLYQNIEWESMIKIREMFRFQATQIPYLEAFEEIWSDIDYIFQTISGGYGIVWAYNASLYAPEKWWIAKLPKLYGIQPEYANPFSRAWQSDARIYKKEFSVIPKMWLAYAVQRWDASDCYEEVSAVVRNSDGGSIDVTEEEIINAKKLLYSHEVIDIGYTASVGLAWIIKMQNKNQIFKHQNILLMSTWKDRDNSLIPTPNIIHSI